MYGNGHSLQATGLTRSSKLSACSRRKDGVMESQAAKVKKYQERAEQIRRISVDVRGDAARTYLLDVASDYEQMAKNAGRARDAGQS